jgi:nucleoside-diphosphate-sugar epimerase
MKPKSLLLIGGTGFFGKSILKYFSNSKSLKKKINKIIIISRKKLEKVDYVIKLKKNYDVVKINCDILKLKKLPFADYVIYCAILKNFKDDFLAVKNYINLAKIYHRNSKILYTSSGAVYGVQNKIRGFEENHLKLNKKINFRRSYKNSYSYFKLKSERLFQTLASSGLKVSIARCFSFVSEFLPLNSHYVIGNIIKNILDKKKIIIKANYKIYRSYMHSNDLIKWLIKILDYSNNKCPIYNVGSEKKVTICQIVKFLAKKYKLQFKIPEILLKKKDIYIPNVYKAKKELNLVNELDSIKNIIKTISLIKKTI